LTLTFVKKSPTSENIPKTPETPENEFAPTLGFEQVKSHHLHPASKTLFVWGCFKSF
jgi:hypothetical protein